MLKLDVTINREIDEGDRPLKEVFIGFERVGAVKAIFGGKTNDVLEKTRVVLQERKGYLRVDDTNGKILISILYLKNGDEKHLYLDLIHELVHVRQYMEGRELFDKRYSYVDRPTEIEAYSVAVKEAKRIGMNYEEIEDYLKVEWVTDEEFNRMLTNLHLRPTAD